jgi:hypothetical protein
VQLLAQLTLFASFLLFAYLGLLGLASGGGTRGDQLFFLVAFCFGAVCLLLLAVDALQEARRGRGGEGQGPRRAPVGGRAGEDGQPQRREAKEKR